jgi:hypothetical protein
VGAVPEFSGPAPAGWASGSGGENFVLAAGPVEHLLLGEGLADHRFALDETGQADSSRRLSAAGFGYVEPVEEKVTTTRRTYRVPAGKYTTIVLGAHGTVPMRPALIELYRGDDKFPISAGPGANYFITFAEGWEVHEGQARVVITTTTSNHATSTSADGFAWGITARGPVAFPEQVSP